MVQAPVGGPVTKSGPAWTHVDTKISTLMPTSFFNVGGGGGQGNAAYLLPQIKDPSERWNITRLVAGIPPNGATQWDLCLRLYKPSISGSWPYLTLAETGGAPPAALLPGIPECVALEPEAPVFLTYDDFSEGSGINTLESPLEAFVRVWFPNNGGQPQMQEMQLRVQYEIWRTDDPNPLI